MELKSILEALLFSSQKPVSAKELRQVFVATGDLLTDDEDVQEHKGVKTQEITKSLEALAAEYEESKRSFQLVQVAGAWQLVAKADFAPWIRTLVGEKQRPARLSAPAMETLAIIAYRQPITRSAIESIRGVSIDGTMQKLLERGLIEQTGKAEVVGRPSLYGTTDEFLEYFGLATLEELPAAEELRELPVEKPETLATAEPGLATVPPEQLSLEEAANLKENSAAAAVPDDEEYQGIEIGSHVPTDEDEEFEAEEEEDGDEDEEFDEEEDDEEEDDENEDEDIDDEEDEFDDEEDEFDDDDEDDD